MGPIPEANGRRMWPPRCHEQLAATRLLDRARVLDADHVLVLAQGSEAGEWTDGEARELFSADAAYAAAERNCANQAPLLPALELFSRNQFSGSHEALSVTAKPNN